MLSQNSPSEENRKRANELIKGVDQLIKAAKLDEALKELTKAKEIDPQNGYIKAFEERISFLTDEKSRKNGVDAARKRMEDEARKKMEDERARIEEEHRRKELEIVKRVHEAHDRVIHKRDNKEPEIGANTPPRQASTPSVTNKVGDDRRRIEEESKRKFEEEFRRAEETSRQKSADDLHARTNVSSPVSTDAHSIYKRVLLLAWADGALSHEEQDQLKDLRASLSISSQEHEALELEAKHESYSHAFKLIWTSGLNASERSSVVAELRKKFQISPEVHSRLESKILNELAPTQKVPTIFVVDDEDEFLSIIVCVLENAGFRVRAFNTSDDALVGLQTEIPSLIISDINLETSSSGGFAFYEMIRHQDNLLNVPFIFLSGMSDEGMIRYGKGLGADDYLTKPISNETLLDTIKGKLKRFKSFRAN